MLDCLVIGGGLVGLASALALTHRYPRWSVALLEKEAGLARHQSGRNSGVLHSGIYYPPGSLKARLCRRSASELVEFCRRHEVPHRVCGKLILATESVELGRLEELLARGRQNGLRVTRVAPEEVREREPHVRCLAALWVPETGVVDFPRVAARMGALLQERGCELCLSTRVESIRSTPGGHRVACRAGDGGPGPEFEARWLVNCGGLFSDRLARAAGLALPARILPFRGEFFELTPEASGLVRVPIYPLPGAGMPFLGVHFTPDVRDRVHCGPNAVLALKREGYRRTDLDLSDLADILGYPGFWRLARRHLATGLEEALRSTFKGLFVRSLQRLVPEVRSEHLVPAPSGVRAQAVRPEGALVDDFLWVEEPGAVHVLNAPSPAATSCLAIGREVAARVGP